MNKDLHRWKKSLDDRTAALLEEGAKHLKLAWEEDAKDPKSYPFRTDQILCQIDTHLRDTSSAQSNWRPRTSVPPETLFELLNERTIKAIYEQQNAGSYRDALKQAASGSKQSLLAFRN